VNDRFELTEQTVYILNGIKLLPHYTALYYVTPGHTKKTPMKLWTVRELKYAGAVESTEFLWPRDNLASGGY